MEALEQAGVRPNRQLGQNFLCDPNVAQWITDQLELKPEDAVVEVGPGTGALSELVLGKVRRLILIEFDSRLAAWLKERFRDRDDVEVHHADGARFDPRVLWKHRPLKFLGNLPYSSGGAIMRNLLSRPHPFERAVIMLQKEVIDRLGAVPRTKAYGVLSLRVQCEWKVTPLKVVPPEAFHPRPQIDSSVAVLEPLTNELPVFDGARFDELIRRGFSQRRKQLQKQLPAEPAWSEVAPKMGLLPTVRAEELTLEQWVEVARIYDEHPLKELPQKGDELFDVVDESDEVVGEATRAEVHEKGLIHRAVHVFAINHRGELLLQLRSRLKDAHPGVWDSSVAGHLDRGENYRDAAIREMEEEMGIVDLEPEEVGKLPPTEATGWEHVVLYMVRWDGKPHFPCSEVESTLWLSADEVDAWTRSKPDDFASGFLECWKLARGRG
ncbi:16S rRNA (adenine(1518)-N(6)/adenine(1519)-N(6))-dimethyltransferase RsmA [Haloferula rosea]|uniref:Ribosomal RNA small subunit methyltransferase A n=1 Tax=Haloferula rosea TaxID=490093 RepID=A0A934VBP1_9BACT|nr:16S rRNA (adenine(1518)-N(6)/adenine(1519)-N(6))-dimethyltransferase RsmA [Haloferula rosea]MBK1827598.1 ribosomal RNA small subunit methyltransferase A [Haloferula rosea]